MSQKPGFFGKAGLLSRQELLIACLYQPGKLPGASRVAGPRRLVGFQQGGLEGQGNGGKGMSRPGKAVLRRPKPIGKAASIGPIEETCLGLGDFTSRIVTRSVSEDDSDYDSVISCFLATF